jgi:hypothetical protein
MTATGKADLKGPKLTIYLDDGHGELATLRVSLWTNKIPLGHVHDPSDTMTLTVSPRHDSGRAPQRSKPLHGDAVLSWLPDALAAAGWNHPARLALVRLESNGTHGTTHGNLEDAGYEDAGSLFPLIRASLVRGGWIIES